MKDSPMSTPEKFVLPASAARVLNLQNLSDELTQISSYLDRIGKSLEDFPYLAGVMLTAETTVQMTAAMCAVYAHKLENELQQQAEKLDKANDVH